MTVEIAPGVEWINACHVEDGVHEHVAVYLLSEGDRHVLIDSGSFYHREGITESILDVTGGQGVDALILSHTDYPHSANIDVFRDEWNLDLVASASAPDVQGLTTKEGLPKAARKSTVGETMTIAGREFTFVDPPLADRAHTTWIYDHGSGGLFTADAFGSYHREGECHLVSTDGEDVISYTDVYEFHRNTFPWLRFVDAGKLGPVLEDILSRYDVSFVAPVHGHPVVGRDVERYLDHLIEATAELNAAYTVPSA